MSLIFIRNSSMVLLIFILPPLSWQAAGQTIAFSYPLRHMKITSSYGMRMHPVLGEYRFHHGIDLASHRDTVKSILTGKVLSAGYSQTLGYYVLTRHGDMSILYGHLSAIWVKQGSHLQQAQPLGRTGNTGMATGDHLHLEVRLLGRTINPVLLFKQLEKLNH